ncbi:MAG: AAA family ATPase [Pseudodesulfovibrio sp.]|nr:AAA family ATPase [Pseudodesulfovibrio sp.]
MHRNFWILSPNVYNDDTEQEWKEVIAARKCAYIGYEPDDTTGKKLGPKFNDDIQEGDVIIVAQGANRNKHCYLCGIVNSPAAYLEEKGTPGYAQRRTLIHTLNEEELSVLELNFNDCSYGAANRIPALYELKPRGNENDQRITSVILAAINKKGIDELMESLKLSAERQAQIKALWEKFKSGISENSKLADEAEFKKLISQWKKYREKIIADTLSLDDYTNILSNSPAEMPGGYLCNFLERTTKTILGSSKPGNAKNFGVKLNDDDNSSYYIQSENKETASKEEAEVYFNEHVKGLLKSIVEEDDALVKSAKVKKANYSAKQMLMKMAVLDNPKDFLQMYATESIEKLHGEFIDGDSDMDDLLQLSHQVCMVAKDLLKVDDSSPAELIQLSRFLWKYVNSSAIADVDSPNVIMYGPPGTGKTYSVVNSLDFVSQGDSSCYEILQFHPSFSYEDFIEGIKPKGVSKDGNIRFELVNGVFKNFCIKAKNTPHKTFYFVVDEINRANLSAVFGETLTLLEKSYRHDGKNDKNLIKTQYSSLIEDLIKENPTKNKDLAYHFDKETGEVKFGVPENLFFIGMMNDVDKSIDSFDLALRRRFKWVRKECDYDVIKEETRFKGKDEFINIDKYVKSCEKLNDYISKELGLGTSYEFGHSFFMKMSDISKASKISQSNVETLFKLYLQPTLKEYLRAVFAETKLDSELRKALVSFKKNVK